jgi:rhodanese-related sulfurtransferase
MSTTILQTRTAPQAPRDVHLAVENGAALIDVRNFDEFAAGHAVRAVCIPLPDIERRAGQLPTDRGVYVMCASGGRSAMAVERLRALGFESVADVDGGFTAWDRAGLPVVKQKGIIPLERQVRAGAGLFVFGFTLAGLLVNPLLHYGALFVGFMLVQSSITGICPMLSLLKRMPWNRAAVAANTSCGS